MKKLTQFKFYLKKFANKTNYTANELPQEHDRLILGLTN
jgi:hypothetical protein